MGSPLDGVTFETLSNATFQSTVPGFPFPDGSVFGDPNRPNDAVAIFVKSDPERRALRQHRPEARGCRRL